MERKLPEIQLAPVSKIRREFPYVCRYQLHAETLAASVRQHGILQPLWLSGDTLVSGHLRFQAALETQLTHVPVLKLDSASPKELFHLALLSNWNQNLADLDCAWVLHQAVKVYGWNKDSARREILPLLGLAPENYFFDEYFETANLQKPLLDLIAAGKLPFRGAKTLHAFSAADQIAFTKILERASFTTNQLMQVVEWLFDLLKSSGQNLETYLEKSGLLRQLDLEDRKANGERFARALRSLRFPSLVAKEEAFRKSAHEFTRLFAELNLDAPPHFEEEGYRMRVRLKNPEALEKLIDALGQNRKLLKQLFQIVV